MKILIISHKYPPSIGGMQTHCFQLVKELKKEHDVHELIWKNNYPRIFFLLTVVPRALWKLRKGMDVIYVNDGLMALFSTPLMYLTSVPMTVTIHGLDINFPLGAYQWWIRRFLNKFRAIITVSGPTTELAIQKGLAPHIITRVDNAVDITVTETVDKPEFRKELGDHLGIDLTNKFLLTSLGRAIPRKGFGWFTKSVVPLLPQNCVYLIIARKFPEARLFKRLKRITPHGIFEKLRLLVGAEIDEEAVSLAIKEHGLESRVFPLHEFTHSRTQIFEIIRHSDLFVMPNIKIKGDYEGFGLVALEAASQGTLTLAANVDGIPSAIRDGINGFLVEGGNSEKWAKVIRYWMNHPEELRETANRFRDETMSTGRSWSRMTSEYVKVFSKIT